MRQSKDSLLVAAFTPTMSIPWDSEEEMSMTLSRENVLRIATPGRVPLTVSKTTRGDVSINQSRSTVYVAPEAVADFIAALTEVIS